MSDISAEQVKELREKTGAGILDCRKALSQTQGDLEKAIEFLRKEGTVKAAKKSGRATSEGLIGVSLSADRRSASVLELNCETDFVARTDQFQEFLAAAAETILKNKPADLNALGPQPLGTSTVQEGLTQMIAKLGENMSIRRFRVVSSDAAVGTYLHAGAKIGALVALQGEGDETLAKEIAMHVAAMGPRFVNRTQVPASVLEKEKEIIRASPEIQAKPENLRDKITEGKLGRFFSENCLLEQPFIKDTTGKKTVADYLKEKAPKAQISEVVRFQVGEENI